MSGSLDLSVRILRRNWWLPLIGLVMAVAGGALVASSSPLGALGIVGVWIGGVMAIATAWRNSFPLSRLATLTATSASIELPGETIAIEDVVEAKLVPKWSAAADTVVVLTVRGRGQRKLWMKGAEAAALVRLLGVEAGDARAAFRLVLRRRTRLLLATLACGLPVTLYLTGIARHPEGAFVPSALVGFFLSLVLMLILGLVRGRLRVGADGLTTRFLFRERFTPFADVVTVVRESAPLAQSVTDTVVILADQRSVVLRAPEEPDDESDRGAEGRALFAHVEAAFARYRSRVREEVDLRTALSRGGRSEQAWLADLDKLLRGGGARYRIATVEPEQVAAVVRDPASPREQRLAGAAALVRFDPAYRTMVQRTADACAEAELQATLAAIGEAGDDESMVAALRRRVVEAK